VRSFFKYFLASLLAILVFCGLSLLILLGLAGGLLQKEASVVPARSVLVVDLSRHFRDMKEVNPLLELAGDEEDQVPSLAQLLRVIERAADDSAIRGIYLVVNQNSNGFAASGEIRQSLESFRKSGKFIIAYGDYIMQKSYHVANVASQVYVHPKGMIDWRGFSVEYVYFRNLLAKLEVEPQIFYDGRFKSATEPFREERMTDANRIQTEAWLGDIYSGFLSTAARARGLDTATLHRYAEEFSIRTPEDALRLKLVDGLKYDDEVKAEIKRRIGLAEDDKISFVTPGTYLASGKMYRKQGKDRIALVVAEGEIVYGRGQEGMIASDEYRDLLRKIRYTDDIKAVVLRVNSPGGSSLASEIIWREVELLRKAGKPVVVSMGDLAASGGYYISCNADSIFAQPNTLTGSIGVFAIVPNMQAFMKNKLGITFDRVKTARYADAMTVTRPLNASEKAIIQQEVDQIYRDFKGRVAAGRKLDPAVVDSIAQGRVWTGNEALRLRLVDGLGGLDRAIRSAAAMAKLKDYSIRDYPDEKSPLDLILGGFGKQYQSQALRSEMGDEAYQLFMQVKRVRAQSGSVQARWPFDLRID
jgi:protease-4